MSAQPEKKPLVRKKGCLVYLHEGKSHVCKFGTKMPEDSVVVYIMNYALVPSSTGAVRSQSLVDESHPNLKIWYAKAKSFMNEHYYNGEWK